MIQEQHKRKLGFFEKFYVCRNVEKYSTNFNVSGQYSQKIDRVLLSNSLRSLILKNPSFTLNIFREGEVAEDARTNGDNFTVQPVERITFDDVVTFQNIDGPFEEELLRTFSERCPINDVRPLWRVYVYESSIDKKQYVTFSCDHTFFDGNSGAIFHKDLVAELDRVSQDQTSQYQDILFDYAKDAHLLPAVLASSDKIVDLYNSSFFYAVLTIMLMKLPKWLIRVSRWFQQNDDLNADSKPLYTHKPAEKDVKSGFQVIHLDPQEVSRILTFCKHHNTTLTPYFTAVAMYSLQNTVYPHVTTTPCSTEIGIAMDGRRFYPDISNETKYGLYVGQYTCKIGPIPKSNGTFDHLRRPLAFITTTLASSIESKIPFCFTGLLKHVNSWQFLQEKIGLLDSKTTLEISNLGLKLFHSNAWSVDNLWFGQTCNIISHFCFSVIATKSNGLNVVLSYLADLDQLLGPLGASIMDEFAVAFKANLLEYA